MRFKKTLIAAGVIAFGLIIFVINNNKKSPTVMPARTVTLNVLPEAEAEFIKSVRTFATARQMGLVDQPDTPGAIVILLQAKDEHINITRYGGPTKPVSANFYRTGGIFGTSKTVLNKDAEAFITTVTSTPGVTLAK